MADLRGHICFDHPRVAVRVCTKKWLEKNHATECDGCKLPFSNHEYAAHRASCLPPATVAVPQVD